MLLLNRRIAGTRRVLTRLAYLNYCKIYQFWFNAIFSYQYLFRLGAVQPTIRRAAERTFFQKFK